MFDAINVGNCKEHEKKETKNYFVQAIQTVRVFEKEFKICNVQRERYALYVFMLVLINIYRVSDNKMLLLKRFL